MNHLQKYFNRYSKKAGIMGGFSYNVLRPNYALADSAEYRVATTPKTVRMEKASRQDVEIGPTEGAYFDVHMDRLIIQPGDVLTPVDPSTLAPAVTILHVHPMKPLIAMKMNRIGKITKDIDTIVYDNVRYAFFDDAYAHKGWNPQIEGDIGLPHRMAIIYKRINIERGMRLIEENPNGRAYRWIINNFIPHTNVITLMLDDLNT